MGSLPDDVVANLVAPASTSESQIQVGIKSIDIFSPLAKNGLTGIFAEWGLGLLVLMPELLGRLEKLPDRHTVFAFLPPLRNVNQWREVNGEIAVGTKRLEVFYIPVADPLRSNFIKTIQYTNSTLVLSRRLAEQDIWPCVDPRRSCSEVRTEQGHQIADRVREVLEQYYTLQFSTSAEANRTLSSQEWKEIRRARLASQFLSQPFFVAEPYTDRPGIYADQGQSEKTFERILAGDYDDRPKNSLSMIGSEPQ
jgi:F0F1-type ATP synthase beta subunit